MPSIWYIYIGVWFPLRWACPHILNKSAKRLGATVKVGLIFRLCGHCACHETKAGAITDAGSGTLAIKTQLLARLGPGGLSSRQCIYFKVKAAIILNEGPFQPPLPPPPPPILLYLPRCSFVSLLSHTLLFFSFPYQRTALYLHCVNVSQWYYLHKTLLSAQWAIKLFSHLLGRRIGFILE